MANTANSIFQPAHPTGTAMQWSFPGCPAPPDWMVDWNLIRARFSWLSALADTSQDPFYHAEGDLLTHTRMVVEALAEMPAWRDLPETERAVLYAAALLHDIAKPECTVIEADGRVTSRGHARRGEQRTRMLLWRGESLDQPAPLVWREQIAKLVRHHGLPLWFLEKASPERAVTAASQVVRLDHAALLAEADVRGRLCADKSDLLDRIALFREFCREARCYNMPRTFASDHSRFLYFQGRRDDLDHAAYDDTAFEVVLMSGLPGAGKDTWLRAHLPAQPVVSLDQLRAELRIDPADDQGAVVRAAKERARQLLRQRRSFVWNATNITRQVRAPLIGLFSSYAARVKVVYIDAPFDAIIARNRQRKNAVPERVIERLASKLELPDLTEAHTVEWVST
jgi:predicted kinase